jgi:hypothetical protein
MKSNNTNINYGRGEQPLCKGKFNELANDDKPAAEDEKQYQLPDNLSKKKYEQQGNDDLEVCKIGLK